jgi:trimethylamine--corrinoid protein Co-methyltransferase
LLFCASSIRCNLRSRNDITAIAVGWERMTRRARGLRRERQELKAGAGGGVTQLPSRQLRSPYRPFELISADELEAIHQASLRVLEEIGLNFLLPEAREILRQAGAEVEPDGTRVRFDRALIEREVAKAPPLITLHARNPARSLRFGENYISFALVGSPPNVSDLERGRCNGNFADFCDLLRLGQSLNIAHLIGGYPVEPIDLPPATRHLDAYQAMVRLSDKPNFGYALGGERMRDFIEMARIARGLSYEELSRQPSLWTVINSNSPLQYDIPMLEGMIEMARSGQILCITPFTLAGAMAPVTVVGALVQQNAEALAGIAFVQLIKAGAPVIYGGFTSNVDMKTGSPAFGTPEYAKATLIGGQLARRYNLPYRSSNVNASNAPDGQAVYESEMSIWATAMGHTNLVMHALGWLEGGLCASYEKIILDAEMLQMMAEFLRPLEVDEASLGIEAMRDVGPGGHFFATQHTLDRYDSAFYAPLLSDWRNFETWQEAGELTATQRANGIWKQLLADYQPPPLDPAIDEELQAFVDRRKAEGGIKGT